MWNVEKYWRWQREKSGLCIEIENYSVGKQIRYQFKRLDETLGEDLGPSQ